MAETTQYESHQPQDFNNYNDVNAQNLDSGAAFSQDQPLVSDYNPQIQDQIVEFNAQSSVASEERYDENYNAANSDPTNQEANDFAKDIPQPTHYQALESDSDDVSDQYGGMPNALSDEKNYENIGVGDGQMSSEEDNDGGFFFFLQSPKEMVSVN